MRAAVESDHPAALRPTIQILSLFFSQPARAASFDAEEIARKGQEVREMTRELDLWSTSSASSSARAARRHLVPDKLRTRRRAMPSGKKLREPVFRLAHVA